MTERKFTTLRKRLDQLGYRQALGIESVPLVEKLFSDLVHTTESLKNLKLQVGKQEKERTVFEDNVEPYRSDNAKLVKENNELHLQLIKLREETDHVIRDLKTSVRKLEHENADLKFLNTQYVHKVKALEKENKAKTERIQDLQEKNYTQSWKLLAVEESKYLFVVNEWTSKVQFLLPEIYPAERMICRIHM